MYSNLIRNLRQVNSLNRSLCQIQSYSYSNGPLNKGAFVDPFGLAEEIEKDEPGIAEMVQGIYVTPPRPRVKYNSEDANAQDRNQAPVKPGDSDKGDPFQSFQERHGHWLKSNAGRQLEKYVTAEKVHTPHFGEVRLDSENATTIHGQFDEVFFDPEEAKYISNRKFERLSKRSREIRNTVNVNIISNPTDEMGMGKETSRRIEDNFSAFENGHKKLQQTNSKHQNVSEGPVEHRHSPLSVSHVSQTSEARSRNQEGAKVVSSKPGANPVKDNADMKETPESNTPKTALEYLKMKKLVEAQQKAKASIKIKLGGRETEIDKASVQVEAVKHVPSIYERSDFNDVPHDDVWIYLRKHICFQNNFLIALNKPYGFPMHTPSVECRHSIVDFLPEFADFAKVQQIFPCHRLDKDTTGVLLLAKSEQAAIAIKRKFANRSIKKLYFAITKNCPEIPEGTIKIPIGEGKVPHSESFRAVLKPDLEKYNITNMQKECKEAVTKFKVVKSQPHGAFIEVYPETGLTHQIRVHLAQGLGCPILGDHKYSHRDKMAPQRLHNEVLDRLKVKQSKVRHLPLHLHSSKLEFTMPDGFMNKEWREPIFIHARPPNFFLHTMRVLGLKH